MFFLAGLIVFLSYTILCGILVYYDYFSKNISDIIHTTINVYSLYIISNLYIGSQIAILKGQNE